MSGIKSSVSPYLAGYALLTGLSTLTPVHAGGVYIAHADHILGTSFDLKISADSRPAAIRAESVILDEIDRLTWIFSSYLPGSEFCRWLAAPVGEPVCISEELFTVLKEFDRWEMLTRGILNAGTEVSSQLWQQAETAGVLPTQTKVNNAARRARQTHWQLDDARKTSTRLSDMPLRMHTFTKSYVLDRVAWTVLALPGVSGVVLDSGGDVLVRGDWTESVALANPRADAENDPNLGQITLINKTVATSGDYRRGVRIGGEQYSHLMNPRTGWPARDIMSATVVHPDAVTAGALATAFAIFPSPERRAIAARFPEVQYLIIAAKGDATQSSGWEGLLVPPSESLPASTNLTAKMLFLKSAEEKLWKADQELLINLTLSKLEGRYHRPFVAVWIEGPNRKPVRNLAVWYNKPRWLPELRAFSNHRYDVDLNSIASATRSPGTYTLRWDGKNDAGEYVNQGKYTICIEAAP